MIEYPKISDSEWEVMKVLWKKSPLTSTDIIKEMKGDTSWSPKTIHTLIDRLVKKGAVEAQKGTSLYEYKPIFSQDKLRQVETKSFVRKMYDGSINLLISNFIKQEKLSPDEIEELKNILDNKMDK